MPFVDGNTGSWTATQLLSDVRAAARIPAGSLDYDDAYILTAANLQIWSFAGWVLQSAGPSRATAIMQRSSAAAFTTPYGPGREVDLPFDALGDTFDSVFWLSASNVEHRLEVIDLASQPIYDTPISQSVAPWGYSVINGRLRLYPMPNSEGTIRINYQRRHPALVVNTDDESFFWSVDAATYEASTITLTPNGATPLQAGDYCDVINGEYPYRYVAPLCLVSDPGPPIVISNYNETTLSGDLVDKTLVRAGSSPYVMLPLEFRAALTNKIGSEILTQIGDQAGASVLEARAERELARVIAMLSPRTNSSRQKIVNPFSLLRTRRWGRWGF